VEPLHFTCHAASDGTKMEKIDPGISTINIGPTLYDNTANNNGVPDIKTIHYYTCVSISYMKTPNLKVINKSVISH